MKILILVKLLLFTTLSYANSSGSKASHSSTFLENHSGCYQTLVLNGEKPGKDAPAISKIKYVKNSPNFVELKTYEPLSFYEIKLGTGHTLEEGKLFEPYWVRVFDDRGTIIETAQKFKYSFEGDYGFYIKDLYEKEYGKAYCDDLKEKIGEHACSFFSSLRHNYQLEIETLLGNKIKVKTEFTDISFDCKIYGDCFVVKSVSIQEKINCPEE